MNAKIKRTFLHASKWLGLFRLSGMITDKGLRILCYHGFTLGDESAFRAKLFMDLETFQRRLVYLGKKKFPVIALDVALQKIERGELPARAMVITIDDGFYSVHKVARGMLEQHGFPATVYVTSYYYLKQTPVFRLAVQYLFWKTSRTSIDLFQLDHSLSGRLQLPRQKEAAMCAIIRHGEESCDEPQRVALGKKLGELLGVDYEQLRLSRALSLMNEQELKELAASGLEIQLHTHRHRLPEEERSARREIQDNRASLARVATQPLVHFCYPSGLCSEKHWPWLSTERVASATTCAPGLNYRHTPKLGLNRFLDGQDVSQIEFEAEVWGYLEILRAVRRALAAMLGTKPRSPSLEADY